KYPSIRRPVFIVAEADSVFRRTAAERLHADVPGSTLELLPGTGHFVQFEKTDDVVRTIRRAAGQSGDRTSTSPGSSERTAGGGLRAQLLGRDSEHVVR